MRFNLHVIKHPVLFYNYVCLLQYYIIQFMRIVIYTNAKQKVV